jgi:hypothetical protein
MVLRQWESAALTLSSGALGEYILNHIAPSPCRDSLADDTRQLWLPGSACCLPFVSPYQRTRSWDGAGGAFLYRRAAPSPLLQSRIFSAACCITNINIIFFIASRIAGFRWYAYQRARITICAHSTQRRDVTRVTFALDYRVVYKRIA